MSADELDANLRGRPMTPEELAVILADHGRWLRGDGGARADLSGADLSGADLSGADLRGADLRDANMRGADMRSADLRSANLDGSRGLAWAAEGPVGQGRRTLTAWWDGERVMIGGGCWRGTLDKTLAVIEGEPWDWSEGSPEDRERWRAEVGDTARRLHARALAQVDGH